MRPQAALVLAVMVLGPGLMVNAVLKEHWGRPRPHQTLDLGGTQDFVPPLAMGAQRSGKSFPCGHSSVGFALAVFYLIWRRRRPRLARVALVGALVVGGLLGVGRMAAGDHFLSDVIWSAVIVYGVALALYQWMRIPEREDAGTDRPYAQSVAARHPLMAGTAFTLVAAAMLTAVLAATPVHENRTLVIRQTELPGPAGTLRIAADQAQVVIAWSQDPEESARVRVKSRGFGLPAARVSHTLERSGSDVVLDIDHLGLFTEKDTSINLIAHPRAWSRIAIAIASGDIRVHVPPGGAPELSLETGDGQLLRDDL
jgi:hypothetical protein